MTKLKPIRDRILIKRLEPEAKTVSGIIIPDTAKEKPLYGEVVDVGPGKMSDKGVLMHGEIRPGDKVLFGRYTGVEVTHEGEELLIVNEPEILAIVGEEK